MTVVFEQVGTSFTATASGALDGFNFTNPQCSAVLVTNTGGNAASVQFSVNDSGQYALWPAAEVPGVGTIILPGSQQVLLTNTAGVADGTSAYTTYICQAPHTTTLVFNLGTV